MCASSTIVVEQQLYAIECQADRSFKVTSLRELKVCIRAEGMSELVKVYQYTFCMCASSTIVVEQQLYAIECQADRCAARGPCRVCNQSGHRLTHPSKIRAAVICSHLGLHINPTVSCESLLL